MGSADDLKSDPVRIEFIRRALESASLMIETQHESTNFRRSFKYSIVSAEADRVAFKKFSLLTNLGSDFWNDRTIPAYHYTTQSASF